MGRRAGGLEAAWLEPAAEADAAWTAAVAAARRCAEAERYHLGGSDDAHTEMYEGDDWDVGREPLAGVGWVDALERAWLQDELKELRDVAEGTDGPRAESLGCASELNEVLAQEVMDLKALAWEYKDELKELRIQEQPFQAVPPFPKLRECWADAVDADGTGMGGMGSMAGMGAWGAMQGMGGMGGMGGLGMGAMGGMGGMGSYSGTGSGNTVGMGAMGGMGGMGSSSGTGSGNMDCELDEGTRRAIKLIDERIAKLKREMADDDSTTGRL